MSDADFGKAHIYMLFPAFNLPSSIPVVRYDLTNPLNVRASRDFALFTDTTGKNEPTFSPNTL
jgi:hypothetical protein